MKLKDKFALITRGAQGLGKSIALAMAREGADVVILAVPCSTAYATCLSSAKSRHRGLVVSFPERTETHGD